MKLTTPMAIRSIAWMLAALVMVADQASKFIMRTEIVPDWQNKIFVTPFFNLVHYWNKGMAFSLFSSGPLSSHWILIGISLVITLIVIGWLMNVWRMRPAVAYGMIIGGALSNVLDRLMFEKVFDFLEFHWAENYWPAFNLADTAIVVGVAILFLDMLLERPALPKEEE